MPSRKIITSVIVHDVHCPYQDESAIRVFLDILRATQPQRIILLGDIFDCGQISKFSVPSDRLLKLQHDIDVGTGFIADCKHASPKSKITFQLGNHEDRLPKWAADNPKISNMRLIEPEHFFGLDRLGKIEIVQYAGHVKLKDTILTHGHRVCKNAGATALANLQSYGYSTYCGHVHRIGRVQWRHGNKMLVGYEGGCMCELDPEYMPLGVANWHHGFSIAHEIEGIPELQVQQIQIVDGRAWHNGRLYSA